MDTSLSPDVKPSSPLENVNIARSIRSRQVTELLQVLDFDTTRDFLSLAQHEARIFEEQFRTRMAQERDQAAIDAELNAWCASPEGRATLAALTDSITQTLANVTHRGHIGHDERHILIKDPLASLELCLEEGWQDHRTIVVLGALLHDVGRLPEPMLEGTPLGGVLGTEHPKMSFLLTRMLLEDFPQLPIELSEQLLFSILVHQIGKDQDNLYAQAVQRSDREQLVGPEGIARVMGFHITFRNLPLHVTPDPEKCVNLAIPGKPEDNSMMHHLEFYVRNLYPNMGKFGESRATELKIIQAMFLHLATPPEAHEQIFAPEINRDLGLPWTTGNFKKPISQEMWDTVKNGPDQHTQERMREILLESRRETLLLKLFTQPGATDPREQRVNFHDSAASETGWDRIVSAYRALTYRERTHFDRAVAFLLARSEALEIRAEKAVEKILETYAPDSIPCKVAAFLIRKSGSYRTARKNLPTASSAVHDFE